MPNTFETIPALAPSTFGTPLVTVGDVSDLLDAPAGGQQRERAGELARVVTSDFETLTGRLWAYRAAHQQLVTLESPWDAVAWSDLAPITSLAVESSPGWGAPAYSAVDPSLYVADLTLGRLTAAGFGPGVSSPGLDPFSLESSSGSQAGSARWPGTRLRLTVTGGYVPTTCPPDVRRACLVQAAFTAQRLQRANLAMATVAMGNSASSFLAPHYHPYFLSVAASHERH
jgi:hypothetical protein